MVRSFAYATGPAYGLLLDKANPTWLRNFAANQLGSGEGRPSESEVLAKVSVWKQRRDPPFTEQEIAGAIREMASLGWLEVVFSPELPIPPDDLLGFSTTRNWESAFHPFVSMFAAAWAVLVTAARVRPQTIDIRLEVQLVVPRRSEARGWGAGR